MLGDHTKLQDLFTAHEPKTSPLSFLVVVGGAAQETPPEPAQDTAKQEVKLEKQKRGGCREVACTDPLRVTIKSAAAAEDATLLELQAGASIAEVRAALASVAVQDREPPRLVFGGRVLQDEETLMALVATCLDTRQITLHAVA